MKAAALLMLASFGGALADDTQFYYEMPSQTTECFLQNLVENERTIASVTSVDSSKKVMMMVNNPQGRELDRQLGGSTELISDFLVTNGGQHQICFSN
jgi:hypothetical protein